jgi:hypothetical protein
VAEVFSDRGGGRLSANADPQLAIGPWLATKPAGNARNETVTFGTKIHGRPSRNRIAPCFVHGSAHEETSRG